MKNDDDTTVHLSMKLLKEEYTKYRNKWMNSMVEYLIQELGID